MIPQKIKVKNQELPDEPGVYFFFDASGLLLYIGKATSLKRRVGSYFTKAHEPSTWLRAGNRISEMVAQIAHIDYIVTPSVIEALVLEANQIKAKKPKVNILMRDDKSFLYIVITNETFPRPVLMRGHDLERLGVDPFRPTLTKKAREKFLRVFGPYTSGLSLKKALDLVRRYIPWSDCLPPSGSPLSKGGVRGGRARGCFNSHIGKCPGVCSGAIDAKIYRAYIRQLILFFEGKKKQLLREMRREMMKASKELRFEVAAKYRSNISALEHIQDVAIISQDETDRSDWSYETNTGGIDLNGRIEAYDISNISGTSATGSMVVFEEGKPAKAQYRKFKIKTVKGPNDVAMLAEMMRRRLMRSKTNPNTWPLPQIMVIDGGKPQVNRVQEVLDKLGIVVPIIGIAKGYDRKQDVLIFDRDNVDLQRVAKRGKEVFQKVRDEAHRFAVKYHRTLRGRAFIK